LISREPWEEPLTEDVLEYYEELVEDAEVVWDPGRTQHTVTHIIDDNGFEALYIDGDIVGDAENICAHEAIATVCERLGLPIKVMSNWVR
jgi:hypothetical protein